VRLTNYLRDAFVDAAMNDVPEIDYSKLIGDALFAAALETLPAAVQELWKKPALKPYLRAERVYVPHHASYDVPCSESDWDNAHAWADKLLAKPEVARLRALDTAQREHRSALRTKLRQGAYGVSTRKALQEALPEFEKYLPTETTAISKTLPALANVVADFVAAGWPKGKGKVKGEAPA